MPEIEERSEQPYVGIAVTATMDDLSEVVPALNSEVFGWLADHDIAPVGAPFWRYTVVEMPGRLEIVSGVLVGRPVEGDGRISSGVLPAGRYATLCHHGHPDRLREATKELLDWADGEGLTFDASADRTRWGCRLEEYLDDPQTQPDMNQWVTRVAIRLAD